MSTLHEKELELWKKWKKSKFKDRAVFEELYRSLTPLAMSVTLKWSGSGLPTSVIESEVKNLMVDSLYDFDPDRNIQLNTFLINRLKKVSRMVYKYQNVGTIPEQRAIKIDTFKKIRTFLTDKLNRAPTNEELASELKWAPKEVDRMERELVGISLVDSARGAEILDLIYYELTPQEKAVYEYLIGYGGKPELSGQDIAKKLNISPSSVTRIRQSIEEKIKRYKGMI
jgi:DNA-directed RNA polymerase specialized sigma subunit